MLPSVRGKVHIRETGFFVEQWPANEAIQFRRQYGFGMRVGAGGLWGGFGLLKTGRETFSMWISRTDAFVLVRLRGARTLLITPDRPREFLEALGELQRRNDERATPLGSTASG